MFKNIELYVNSSKKKALETFSVVKNKLLSLGFNIVNGTNISPDIVIGFIKTTLAQIQNILVLTAVLLDFCKMLI